MALTYGFGRKNEGEGYGPRQNVEEAEAQFERLNELEKEFYYPDWMLWSLGLSLMAADVGAVTKSTAPIISRRLELLHGHDFYQFVGKYVARCIRRRDPPSIRKMAIELRRDPWKHMGRCAHIFEHWLLDRYAGYKTNVYTEPNLKWVYRLKLPELCEGDDLRPIESGWGNWSPTELLDKLDDVRGKERQKVINQLYHILNNCLYLGEREDPEELDEDDVVDEGPRTLRQFRAQVTAELAEIWGKEEAHVGG